MKQIGYESENKIEIRKEGKRGRKERRRKGSFGKKRVGEKWKKRGRRS